MENTHRIIPNVKRPDIVIMDPKVVAKNYLNSWLAIDVLCGIPFATIGVLTSGLFYVSYLFIIQYYSV
jgi:hypothetical protein